MTVALSNIGDYIDGLRDASSAEDCMALTRRHVGELGFRNIVFSYTRHPQGTDGELPSYLRFSSIPKTWEDHYRRMNYQNHCPIYRASLRGGNLPLIWQEVWDRVDGMTATQRHMQNEAANHGITNGVCIPIEEKNGDRYGIGISTDLGNTEAARIIDMHLPQMFLMTHHLHAVMADRFVAGAARKIANPLTVRELDCLHWVAVGKNTWEISEINSISENTVKYHLRNILSKLDVPTRAAAVAKAFQLGLIGF
ncbi:MAG: LuxR family transcriptional regulator [Rhodospirillaceae bacterium]|nr:LuxR family transcriptional regulator [Rhodospirillaceae bacterium]